MRLDPEEAGRIGEHRAGIVRGEPLAQGASDASTPYAIGRYATKAGSYRVLVKMKADKGVMLIDNLDFAKE